MSKGQPSRSILLAKAQSRKGAKKIRKTGANWFLTFKSTQRNPRNCGPFRHGQREEHWNTKAFSTLRCCPPILPLFLCALAAFAPLRKKPTGKTASCSLALSSRTVIVSLLGLDERRSRRWRKNGTWIGRAHEQGTAFPVNSSRKGAKAQSAKKIRKTGANWFLAFKSNQRNPRNCGPFRHGQREEHGNTKAFSTLCCCPPSFLSFFAPWRLCALAALRLCEKSPPAELRLAHWPFRHRL